MSNSQKQGRRPIRRMGLLVAFLIIGAVVLIALWMGNPPPGVKPLGAATSDLVLATVHEPWTGALAADRSG